MPEGDTILRAARTLHRALAGKIVTRFETRYAQLARVDDDTPVAGRTIESVRAVGKHCLLAFSGDLVLRTHMRMSGSWHVYRPGERWQRAPAGMRVLVAVPDFVAVGFDIPVAEFESARSLAREGPIRQLGPDLLAEDFDPLSALGRVRERALWPIGEALLDQRALAGIGNVFKSEVLFLAGVHPQARVGTLADEVLLEILETSRRLMRANVAPGAGNGIVTYTGLRRTTRRSDPGERLWVYGRRGAPCRRCATPIEMRKLGEAARSTFFCPRCQPPLRAREIPSPAGGSGATSS